MKVSKAVLVAALSVAHSSAWIAPNPRVLRTVTPTTRSTLRLATQRERNGVIEKATAVESSPSGKGVIELADDFQNEGPFAWMSPFLGQMGLVEGKALSFGAFAVDVDDSQRVDKDEAARRRVQAAKDLTNIGEAERQRRDQAGNVMAVLSTVYILWSSLLADDGGLVGHLLRFLAVFPLFLTIGYKESAKTGL